jgi:hypothetical protein
VIWPDPGKPTHPIVIPIPPEIWPSPGVPTHPIVLPPPDAGQPPSIWPSPGFPAHPIVIPPVDPEREKLIDWKVVWSPPSGWVVIGVPNVPVPTPSK